MIKTLRTSYSSTAKTAEIMSRYRPIAPKPETRSNPNNESPSQVSKIRQSPYLRNIWSQLQGRPTRTRKRGRAALSVSPPAAIKRQRTQILEFSPARHVTNPTNQLSLQVYPRSLGTVNSSLVILPLLPRLPSVSVVANRQVVVPELDLLKLCREEKLINLNNVLEIPEDKDRLQQLQGQMMTPNVIAPQPVRPVGSTIRIGCISEDPRLPVVAQATKKAEEVEKEVESEALPAVISDSNYKVRMANSAYKEMVGQPECSWLNSLVTTSDGRLGGRSSFKRISGEVQLQFSDSEVPISSNGFSCWVRIEWGSDLKKNSINAFCDVIGLTCESKDYLFTWRFHTRT